MAGWDYRLSQQNKINGTLMLGFVRIITLLPEMNGQAQTKNTMELRQAPCYRNVASDQVIKSTAVTTPPHNRLPRIAIPFKWLG
jgi:hypothetical protein